MEVGQVGRVAGRGGLENHAAFGFASGARKYSGRGGMMGERPATLATTTGDAAP